METIHQIAVNLFNAYPAVNVLYLTSDKTVFAKISEAVAHASTLSNTQVEHLSRKNIFEFGDHQDDEGDEYIEDSFKPGDKAIVPVTVLGKPTSPGGLTQEELEEFTKMWRESESLDTVFTDGAPKPYNMAALKNAMRALYGEYAAREIVSCCTPFIHGEMNIEAAVSYLAEHYDIVITKKERS